MFYYMQIVNMQKLIGYIKVSNNKLDQHQRVMDRKNKIADNIFTQAQIEYTPTVIESVCTNCYENGETRLLLTKIPFFRQIMLSSFQCNTCSFKNNQVQFAGQLPDYGVQILFKALQKGDLNRQIIISQHAKIWIQQLQIEMPKLKKAQITTFQGLLMGIQQDLQSDQEERKQKNFQQYQKISAFCQKIKQYYTGQKFPISIRIKDISGNSYIKNPHAPKMDKNLHISNIHRTLQDLIALGYNVQNAKQQMKQIDQKNVGTKMNFTKPFEQKQFMKYQPVIFQVPCHSCQMIGQMKMCQTSIPYFTDMVIMSFLCQYCGAHSTETKNTGEVKDQGCLITLKAESDEDLKRDLFKSQTCKIEIKQLQVQLDYGTLGGVFTTVEGLIEKISDHLGQNNPFADSDTQFNERMNRLLSQLQELRGGKKKFTLILRDPFGHSFLSNPYHPNEDPRVTRVLYDRSQQENQIMGITDMKVQNYEKSDDKSQKSSGSMKKSKDRKYSEGSVQSIQQLKNKKQFEEKESNSMSSSSIQQPPIKFTKQSPSKPKFQQAPRKLSQNQENSQNRNL